MKAILLILVIALGGLAFYYKSTAAKQIAAAELAATEVAVEDMQSKVIKAQGDARGVEIELNASKERIALLELEAAEAQKEIDSLLSGEAKEAARIAAMSAEQRAAQQKSADLNLRLAEMKHLYDNHQAKFAAQKATLNAKRDATTQLRKTKEANPPTFQEQRTVEGKVMGGVRTSQADREVALAKHAAEIAAIDAQIAAIVSDLIDLDTREAEMKSAYATAVAKAETESSISDLQGQ